jgi:hypothetical protein
MQPYRTPDGFQQTPDSRAVRLQPIPEKPFSLFFPSFNLVVTSLTSSRKCLDGRHQTSTTLSPPFSLLYFPWLGPGQRFLLPQGSSLPETPCPPTPMCHKPTPALSKSPRPKCLVPTSPDLLILPGVISHHELLRKHVFSMCSFLFGVLPRRRCCHAVAATGMPSLTPPP